MTCKISKLLKEFGIPANLLGYQYLRYAITVVVNEPNTVHSVTKVLYPRVAKAFNTSCTRVERACRHAIELGWNRGNPELIDKYFGWSVNAGCKPTNSEFIATLADSLIVGGDEGVGSNVCMRSICVSEIPKEYTCHSP